jgi:hypothetical protein
MAVIQSYTDFSIQAAESQVESADLLLLPENTGTEALRELHYPNDTYPPIIYPDMPDKWENFDTSPLTARPLTAAQMTLQATKMARWSGYLKDRPVREMWRGTEKDARIMAYFFRRLMEYFMNPPSSGYITWHPKDRCLTSYNIVLEDLSVGGQSVVTFSYPATYYEVLTGELVLTFRIVGEAS